MPAGYSGTPLVRKLGIKPNHRVGVESAPAGFARTLGALPEGAALVPASSGREHDVLLFFVKDTKRLERGLPKMMAKMAPATSLWICWPKKTSPLATDVSGDVVRGAGLAAGIVDIKVCAVDEDWSGLKFVVRVQDRPSTRKK